jgi:chromatin assembly factor 1 subunit A
MAEIEEPHPTSPRSLKRQRDETYADCGLESPLHIPDTEEPAFDFPQNKCVDKTRNDLALNSTTSTITRVSSPARSSTGSLTDAGTSTPPGLIALPVTAFTMLDGVVQPPKKRVKLTFTEQEDKRIQKQIRDSERAQEKARKELERQHREEDKARRDAEKEAERKEKEAERKEKEAERKRKEADKEEKRLSKEAEKAEKERDRKGKEDEKRRKEEEKRKADQEKKKKEGKQPKLNAFFVQKPPSKASSPAPAAKDPSTTPSKSPSKVTISSEYHRLFPPFFVKSNVKLAPSNRFEHERWGSANPEKDLDTYISLRKEFEQHPPFDPPTLFNCPDLKVYSRGKDFMSVKMIMKEIGGGAGRPIDLTTDSQNSQIKRTRNLLARIPFKVIAFQEDTRPPFKGTITNQPISKLRKLARNPIRRQIPELNYDYDSEAEWIDEVEDGEDLDSDDEDEDDGDGEDDLDGFLDDADDNTANARKLAMQGDLEVQSTGLCWEDRKRSSPLVRMYGYRMEIMHSRPVFASYKSSQLTFAAILDVKAPIDPFSTQYWDPPLPAVIQGLMDPPRKPLNIMKDTSSSINGPNKIIKMFGTSDIHKPAPTTSGTAPKKMIHADDLAIFRETVAGSYLSKIGLIEVLHKALSKKSSKAAIKATLELTAKRVGAKEAEKRWAMIDDGTN